MKTTKAECDTRPKSAMLLLKYSAEDVMLSTNGPEKLVNEHQCLPFCIRVVDTELRALFRFDNTNCAHRFSPYVAQGTQPDENLRHWIGNRSLSSHQNRLNNMTPSGKENLPSQCVWLQRA